MTEDDAYRKITSKKAVSCLDRLVDTIDQDGDPVIILSKKGNLAVLISMEEFDFLEGLLSEMDDLDDEMDDVLTLSGSTHSAHGSIEPLRSDFVNVYQLKVSLNDIEPPIWRRIQVPENYSFWDLHVAIQDAMGWLDDHLHEFVVPDPQTGIDQFIGIPGDEGRFEEDAVSTDWEQSIAAYFSDENNMALYIYDFGDDWRHTIKLEKIVPRTEGVIYPVCINGKLACPPEDCGGVHGYGQILETLSNPDTAEYAQWGEWINEDFDPKHFDAREVSFNDPRERWAYVFGAGRDHSDPVQDL